MTNLLTTYDMQPMPAPEWQSKSNEIQYNNRYGLFHFDVTFGTSFPTQVILSKKNNAHNDLGISAHIRCLDFIQLQLWCA